LKRIFFAVTNDLTFDQRMHRICNSLAGAGYDITLVGRKLKTSLPLEQKNFGQKRLRCFFNNGFLFYTEYNLRLFFFLLSQKMDGICAIDLDTILPCLFISKIRKAKRVYDAHEFFTEVKEVRSRPFVKKTWTSIERFAVPKFEYAYTVSLGLAEEFETRYRKNFEVIRNVPPLRTISLEKEKEPFIFYSGAVNEARGFEFLIPAMKEIRQKLVICGDGNFMQQLKGLIAVNKVEDKIILKGMVSPEELFQLAQKASLGINLVEKEGINQYYSLANKFFDYMNAGLPQLSMNYPEYRSVNETFRIAVLIDDLSAEELSKIINNTLNDPELLDELHNNALKGKLVYCWEKEEQKLLAFYNRIFQS
jgi:glycosyltransferase involved in cell wall biosynthesis